VPGVRAQAPGRRATRRALISLRRLREAPEGAGTVSSFGDGVAEAHPPARSRRAARVDVCSAGCRCPGCDGCRAVSAAGAAGGSAPGQAGAPGGAGRHRCTPACCAASAAPGVGGRAGVGTRDHRLGRSRVGLAERGPPRRRVHRHRGDRAVPASPRAGPSVGAGDDVARHAVPRRRSSARAPARRSARHARGGPSSSTARSVSSGRCILRRPRTSGRRRRRAAHPKGGAPRELVGPGVPARMIRA
jgi:hypothetical protein